MMAKTRGNNRMYARMIIHENGKFLVLKNTKRNRWEFPGGKQDKGEDLVTTAQRETKEEIGLVVTAMRFVAEQFVNVEGVDWLGEFWLAEVWRGKPIILEPHKFEELRWVTVDEFAGLPQIPCVGVDLARRVEALPHSNS